MYCNKNLIQKVEKKDDQFGHWKRKKKMICMYEWENEINQEQIKRESNEINWKKLVCADACAFNLHKCTR